MKKTISFCLLLLLCWTAYAQGTGHRSETFDDNSRLDILNQPRTIETEIYYPAATDGDDVPILGTDHPLIVFGHGFTIAYDSYEIFWKPFVAAGYIVALPRTESGFLPNHTDFALDMNFIVASVQALNNDPNSLFYNHVLNRSALMGHSMGGGSALLAAELNPNIETTVTFAAANTNPSTISAAQNITVPSLLFSGSADCITPPANHQQPMYDSLASSCRYWINITDGSHCQFADNSFNCETAEQVTCGSTPTISDAAQLQITLSYTMPWLAFWLKADATAGDNFQAMLDTATVLQYQSSCNAVSIEEPEVLSSILLSPNPATDRLQVSADLASPSKVEISILDLQGKLLHQDRLWANQHLDWQYNASNLSPGMYLIRLFDGNEYHSLKWIKN